MPATAAATAPLAVKQTVSASASTIMRAASGVLTVMAAAAMTAIPDVGAAAVGGCCGEKNDFGECTGLARFLDDEVVLLAKLTAAMARFPPAAASAAAHAPNAAAAAAAAAAGFGFGVFPPFTGEK
eukprot:TRINITY_DN6598_c1_g1_i1.p1 TRINITY_DN6598_c1_g1~~TRINITY_DN6598_c1_g1_i1.p1  ORF type:complete len:126 (+),score=45.11 TRINITY_DN6598_c1_g1_i1:389-766(+)